jgi:hypothetical protein
MKIDMKDLKLFSIEELSVLEALNVKGGIAELATTQNGCPNNVAGCACDIVIVNPKPTVPTIPTIRRRFSKLYYFNV